MPLENNWELSLSGNNKSFHYQCDIFGNRFKSYRSMYDIVKVNLYSSRKINKHEPKTCKNKNRIRQTDRQTERERESKKTSTSMFIQYVCI